MDIPLDPSTEEEKQKDAEMKERFRKFWMMTTAEGFKDELEQIQKVCDQLFIYLFIFENFLLMPDDRNPT